MISGDWLGFELISAAYLLVSGDRKLFFFPRKHKSATQRDGESMQKSGLEEKKKENTDHVNLWKQLNQHANKTATKDCDAQVYQKWFSLHSSKCFRRKQYGRKNELIPHRMLTNHTLVTRFIYIWH